jgi:hypothetical protein
MRKKAILLSAFCLLFVYAEGQRAILLKIKYLPDRTYESTVSMTSNIEMNIENLSKEDSDKLKEKGLTMPIIATTSTLSDLSVITGKVNDRSVFPMIFKYNNVTNKVTLSGKEMPTEQSPLIGRAIYGTATEAGEMHLDSISGALRDTSLRAELVNVFNNLTSELKLPEKTVKVGDTLFLEIPFNMPIGGVDTKFTVKATYRLVSIKKGMANFDIDQHVQFKMNNANTASAFIGNGSGSGKMVYSIKENFFKSIDRDISFDYQMKYKGKTMKGEAKINSSYFFSVK